MGWKSVFQLFYVIIVLTLVSCSGQNKKQIDAAHKLTYTKVATMDSLYNIMVQQEVRTLVERDSLLKVIQNKCDKSYLALIERVKRDFLLQKGLIDLIKIDIEKYKQFLDGIPVLETGRTTIETDFKLLSQDYEKLEKQYKESQESLKSLRLSADEARQ